MGARERGLVRGYHRVGELVRGQEEGEMEKTEWREGRLGVRDDRRGTEDRKGGKGLVVVKIVW